MDRQEMFNKAGVEYKGKQSQQTHMQPHSYIPPPQAPNHPQPGQCFITINGNRYRLAFTMMQMEIFSKEMVKYTMEIEKAACIPYSAILMAARQDGIKAEVSFEDVLMWYDEGITNDTAEYQAYDAAYKQCSYYKRFVQPIEEEQEKKRNLTLMSHDLSLPDV